MKIKRQSPQRLRSSLCQGPAARLWIQEFESSLGSQAVRSPWYYFPVCENPRHSGELGWRAPVSGRQFLAFSSFGQGFRAPVSARHFPISISAERRLVRLLTETGSRNGFRQRRPESTASISSFAQELLKLLATRSRIKLLHPLNQWHAESPLLTKGAQFSAPARPTNRAGLWRDL